MEDFHHQTTFSEAGVLETPLTENVLNTAACTLQNILYPERKSLDHEADIDSGPSLLSVL